MLDSCIRLAIFQRILYKDPSFVGMTFHEVCY